ncbi:MAG TPA: class II D-tagatose-bisphosphate aldolase, non-catalytic subunit [Candidatus Limnocylindrales bacterium]|nr:class II D-tagatose-bisphosphate aldolase, non-catalytic subunit [Candidatus Limnocylindrales bacterium]
MTIKTQTRSASSTETLAARLQQNREGRAVGVYSICSANRHVLEAGMHQARKDRGLLLIESTSNQVNQFGGYTGQTPPDFAQSVRALAAANNLPEDRLVLGADHLGPHVWKNESAEVAIEKACVLARESVLAGYTKIHLDASMHCADDPGDRRQPLPDEVVSERSARICKAAETAHDALSANSPKPVYVIGTEVPVPGGEMQGSSAPEITKPQDLERTIEIAKRTFARHGLHSAWERTIAIVVQPGVEFGNDTVFAYDPDRTTALARFAREGWHGVYEAHSTDYQSATSLRKMVQDHFAILKVGPWLTFAFREAVFALAAMEEEWFSGRNNVQLSRVRETLEQAMLRNPAHWRNYFHGDENALRLARKYSYSDRSRYYWPQPEVSAALERLLANLASEKLPTSLISQFLPEQAAMLREGRLPFAPAKWIASMIQAVLQLYSAACGEGAQETPVC